MSEISDLKTDADKQPEPVLLTSGMMALYAKQHDCERPCEACGHEKFTMAPEGDAATGIMRGVVWLACDRCNAVRTFLRPPIVAWLKEARHGRDIRP